MPSKRPLLSDRAERVLERGARNVAQPNPSDLESAFRDAGIPIYGPVVDVFYHFGGCWFPIGLNRTFRLYDLRAALAEQYHVGAKNDRADSFRIPFGDHPVAQMEFLMDGHGTLYTDDTPVSRSIVHWIENHALMEMVERWENCVRVALPDPTEGAICGWADDRMERFVPASDEYCTWWLTAQTALVRLTPWATEPGHEKWNWLFATAMQHANTIIDDYREAFELQPTDIRPWPP